MMNFIKAWSVTTAVFFAGDSAWLYFVMNRFFVPQIKHLMNVSGSGVHINYVSALCAYLLLSTALTLFVVVPLVEKSTLTIFLNGAFLGLSLYGVYEFTNHATLAQWPLSFLAVDLVWGALWSGMVSVISVILLRYV